MDKTISTILHSWKDRKLPDVIPRDIDLDSYLGMKPRKIIVITGFRRVGKTYLLFGVLNRLLREKGREQAVYINFDYGINMRLAKLNRIAAFWCRDSAIKPYLTAGTPAYY